MSVILHLPESAQSLVNIASDKGRMLKPEQLSGTQRSLKGILELKEKKRTQKAEINIRLGQWNNIQLLRSKCSWDHVMLCGFISRTELQKRIFRNIEYFQSWCTAEFCHPNNVLSQCHLQQSLIVSHFPKASRIFCPDPCHPGSVHLLPSFEDGWTASSNSDRSAELWPALSSPWNPQIWGGYIILKFSCSCLDGSFLKAWGQTVWQ